MALTLYGVGVLRDILMRVTSCEGTNISPTFLIALSIVECIASPSLCPWLVSKKCSVTSSTECDLSTKNINIAGMIEFLFCPKQPVRIQMNLFTAFPHRHEEDTDAERMQFHMIHDLLVIHGKESKTPASQFKHSEIIARQTSLV